MIVVKRLPNGDLLVEPAMAPGGGDIGAPAHATPTRDGLVIHGYGGNKEEMLGLAAGLVESTGVRLLLFDLPGHSLALADKLNLETAVAAVDARLAFLEEPSFFIGHSLGARLGLLADLPAGAIISMPGPALFEGNRREMIQTLRARRVRESMAYEGLRDILTATVEPAADTLLLYAANDIQSAATLARQWQDKVGSAEKIPGCGHLDIVSHPSTRAAIATWLLKSAGGA